MQYNFGPQLRSQVACERDAWLTAMDYARGHTKPGPRAAWLRRAAAHRRAAADYARRLRVAIAHGAAR